MLPNIDDVPVISISNQLNPEQIISLRTELLFIAKGMEVPQRDLLENAGVKVVEYPANSLKSLQERVQATAKELGPDAQSKAIEYQRYFDRNIVLVNERLKGLTNAETDGIPQYGERVIYVWPPIIKSRLDGFSRGEKRGRNLVF